MCRQKEAVVGAEEDAAAAGGSSDELDDIEREHVRLCYCVLFMVTFRVSHRPQEMYCGHARLCVCVSVRGRMPTLLHGPECNLVEW